MNVDWVARLPAPVRRAAYFSLQRAIGSRTGAAWRELQAWERLTPSELEARCEQRLGAVLDHAMAGSEYYRRLGLQRRPGESARDFLRRFPLLSRETVRAEFIRLVADSHRAEITSPESVSRRRYDWLVVKTGGTTGNPTSVVHDARFRDWGRATRLLAAKMCGYPLGVRYFRFWGSEAELLREQTHLPLRVLIALLGAVPLNAFRAREDDLRRHHAALRARPDIDVMQAYVDAAVSLATFIEDRGLAPVRLRIIQACAGTVTPEWRAMLEQVFGAEVFDKYGSRDCAEMACECRAHHGLHVFVPNVHLEIVDAEDRPCPPGVVGRVLVTCLTNEIFPMIRYDVGDLACWGADGVCGCGMAWPRLGSLQGRADDMLVTEDGTLLSSVFVRHFIGVSLNRQIIREWQFEQTGPTDFVFRYLPVTAAGLDQNLRRIEESFRLALGASVVVRMEQVAALPLAASGKMRWIVNSYRTARRAGVPEPTVPRP